MSEQTHHPLILWRSPVVTDLLSDFFAVNYEKAGINGTIARNIIAKAWSHKDATDHETLRKEINKLMIAASDKATVKPTEGDPLEMVDLTQAETFLDYGANKLTTLNHFAQKYPHLKELIAIDVIPQRKDFIDTTRSRYITITDDTASLPIEPKTIDVVHVQFVLHHFKDEPTIIRALELCNDVLKPNGTFYLWEETFTNTFSDEHYELNVQKLGIMTDESLTRRFYELTVAQRWEFIAVNDWLINVSNKHMQWTGQYRTWEEWSEILRSVGFSLTRTENLGLRINGRLKQGVHMLGVFTKEAA